MARPTIYSEAIANTICERMASGESVNSICKDESMPARSTVMLWAATDKEGFSDKYAKAFEARAHYWADELLDIADDSSNDWMQNNDPENPGYRVNGEAIGRARLRVDTRKWLMSKMLPKFSDKDQKLPETTDKEALLKALAALLPD